MYGIGFIAGAAVVASSAPMGVFNGAHLLGLLVMVLVAVAWWRKDMAAWRRFQALSVGITDGDLRRMDTESDREAFKSSWRSGVVLARGTSEAND